MTKVTVMRSVDSEVLAKGICEGLIFLHNNPKARKTVLAVGAGILIGSILTQR